MNERLFLKRTLWYGLALAAAVLIFNAVVDPYVLFGTPRWQGLTDRKSAAATREPLMKAYQSFGKPAKTLVLGSSRSDIGFNPKSDAWPKSSLPVYNLSLAGSDLSQSHAYLMHYLNSLGGKASPEHIVVGLDFESFLKLKVAKTSLLNPEALAQEERAKSDAQRLMLDAGKPYTSLRVKQMFQDYLWAGLSLDACMDSLATLFSSVSKTGTSLSEDGQTSDVLLRQGTHSNGSAGLFQHAHTQLIKLLGKGSRVLEMPEGKEAGENWRALRTLLALSKQNGIKFSFFIQPAHAERLEVMNRLGYERAFDDWKRTLVDIIEQEKAADRIALWDFSGYEKEFTEATPTLKEIQTSAQTPMRWFWDPMHYKSELADRIISKLMNQKSADDFGIALNAQTISARLSDTKLKRDQYLLSNEKTIKRLDQLICKSVAC
jgi:hypothetical protein